MRLRCRSGLRFVALVAVLAGLSLWLALSALAKERVLLSVSLSHPQVGQPVSVRLQIDHAATGACSMRLVAVAPRIDRFHALDALIGGGYYVMGPAGPSFYRLPATPRLGFRAHTHRSTPTEWQAAIKFPRPGRWQLVVPNVCAPGYMSPLPAVRILTVR